MLIDLCNRVASYAYTMPWNHRSLEGRLRRLRKRARCYVGWRRNPLTVFLVRTGATILWPVALLIASCHATRQNAAHARSVCGKSALRQLLEQLRFGLGDFVVPKDYYWWHLYRNDIARQRAKFLPPAELDALNDYLNEFRSLGVIGCKDAFHEYFGNRCGLPTIPIIAYVNRGECKWMAAEQNSLPPADLFVKPAKGSKGIGAEVWRWQAERGYANTKLGFKSAVQLMEHLRRRSYEKALIVQPRLENHPSIARLSSGALCSFRLITARTTAGKVLLLHGECIMPTVSDSVSNFAQGGIAAVVEPQSGAMGWALRGDWKAPPLDRHPSTGEQIVGKLIEAWDQLVAVACDAHSALPDCVAIGWDLAWTPDGAVLIEANNNWGGCSFQNSLREPILATAFADICLEYQATRESSTSHRLLAAAIRQYRQRKKRSTSKPAQPAAA